MKKMSYSEFLIFVMIYSPLPPLPFPPKATDLIGYPDTFTATENGSI